MALGLLSAIGAGAAEAFTLNDFAIMPSGITQVAVSMKNEIDVCGFQCDISLPDGIGIAKSNGKYDIKLSDRAADQTLAAAKTDGVVRVVAYSMSNTAIKKKSGELMTIPVVAGPAVAPGKYIMRIKGIKINDGSIEYALADVTCTITVNKREVNDAFAVGNVSVMQGSTVPVPVSMANAIKACGFQCDITVPSGLSIAKDSNGKTMVKLTSRASDHVAATSTLANGDVRLLVYSMSNTPFSGTGGELFSIPVVATESTPVGNYNLTVKNIKINDSRVENQLPNVTGTVSVTKKTVRATSVALDATAATLQIGATKVLTATVLPANADNKSVTWKTDNAAVAKVENGTVTAVAVGTATITATTADGSNLSASCKVTVKPILATSITLDATVASLKIGATKTLVATVLPANATNKAVTWKSSNDAIAKVVNGTVTAIAPGTATITATTADGSNLSASCTVAVNAITASSITLSANAATLKIGDTQTLTATVLPSNTTSKSVTWKTDNAAVAKVENGTVTAIAVGSATITATTTDGSNLSASCKVTVTPILATAVKLDKTTATLEIGGSTTFAATVLPSNATNKSVTWATSNAAVAKVDNNGTVTAVAVGTAKITATAADGSGVSASADVTVKSAPNYITLSDVAMRKGKKVMVPICLNNEMEFCGFQCDITLPEGFDIEKDKKGRYAFGLTDRADDHTVSSRFTEEGVYRMVVVSFTNTSFEGNSGALVNVPLMAAEDVAPGEYTMKVSNFRISNAYGNEKKLPIAEMKITIKSFTPGDVNDDGEITVSDAVVTISQILGITSTTFNYDAADMTGDGEITVADVTKIISAILDPTMNAGSVALAPELQEK